jgi:hypothetical protein
MELSNENNQSEKSLETVPFKYGGQYVHTVRYTRYKSHVGILSGQCGEQSVTIFRLSAASCSASPLYPSEFERLFLQCMY